MSLGQLKYLKSRARAIRALIVMGVEGGEDGDKAAKALDGLNPSRAELERAVRWLKRNDMVSEGTL